MNAFYALIAILSLAWLARWVSRGRAVVSHPVGPLPPPICELHRDGAVDADTATALIDEVA